MARFGINRAALLDCIYYVPKNAAKDDEADGDSMATHYLRSISEFSTQPAYLGNRLNQVRWKQTPAHFLPEHIRRGLLTLVDKSATEASPPSQNGWLLRCFGVLIHPGSDGTDDDEIHAGKERTCAQADERTTKQACLGGGRGDRHTLGYATFGANKPNPRSTCARKQAHSDEWSSEAK